MKRNGNTLTTGVATILHSLVVPVFALVFLAFYRPARVETLLSSVSDDYSFAFNLTIIFCISLVSLSIMRVWLYIIGRYRHVSRPVYAVWCVGEVLVVSLFAALYISLMSHGRFLYFDMVGLFFLLLLMTFIYPYAFLWLGIEFYYKFNEPNLSSDSASLVRFHDEYHKLRLVIASEAVIFIRSEDNYVVINYADQGRIKKFSLRSSMRALEEMLSRHGLVRCHRSFFINPSYVKVVQKDSSGVVIASLKVDGLEDIPISRKYQENLTRCL